MLAFLAGDADVLVSTTIIESGLDIPQANTLDRRARGRARARPALPDPRARGPERRRRPRVPLLSRRPGADRRGAGAARDARRPHRARRAASRSRCATSRSAAPATCSARSSPGTSPRSASSSTSSCSARRSPSSSGTRRAVGAPGAGRRAGRRLRPGRRTCRPRRRRSTCTGASRSPSPRTSCASSGRPIEDRFGPVPEPVENLFAIQEAKLKLARLGADYLVFRGRPRRRRAARARLGGAARAPHDAPTPPSTRARSARSPSGASGSREALAAGRCYPRLRLAA